MVGNQNYKEDYKKCLEYPYSLSVYVPVSEKGLKARNEIETFWSNIGDWVGHGQDDEHADVQVCFRTKELADKAKKIAQAVLKKYRVSGHFNEFYISPEECKKMYPQVSGRKKATKEPGGLPKIGWGPF